jgi:micrococcal nuclease
VTWLCALLKIGCTVGTVSGSAYVHDGDTIYIDRQPIRLAGIDAEELDEPHGIAARDHLRAMLQNYTISCKWDGWSYNRKVGTCYLGFVDIGARMVEDGFALDCAHYSGGKYRSLEPAGIRLRLIQKGYC